MEGKSEGKSIVNRLNQILLSANRDEDLIRATNDAAYQEELIKELLSDDQ